jgi:hypothetical protein
MDDLATQSSISHQVRHLALHPLPQGSRNSYSPCRNSNSWSPSDPTAAVALFTAWSPLLPIFLRDNVLDQLILPKLSKAILDWSPSSMQRGGASLHNIVFPWLEHAGDRMEMVLEESKRKIRSWLKGWKVADGVPAGMDAWKEVRILLSSFLSSPLLLLINLIVNPARHSLNLIGIRFYSNTSYLN